jgi:hypothetical protein
MFQKYQPFSGNELEDISAAVKAYQLRFIVIQAAMP